MDNLIHADMHPGNILVWEAQSQFSRKRLFKSKPHVIFIDVGMTAELSKSDRINFSAAISLVSIKKIRENLLEVLGCRFL